MIVKIPRPSIGPLQHNRVGKEALQGLIAQLPPRSIRLNPELQTRAWEIEATPDLVALHNYPNLSVMLDTRKPYPEGYVLSAVAPWHLLHCLEELRRSYELAPSSPPHSWIFRSCLVRFGEWHAHGKFYPKIYHDKDGFGLGYVSSGYADDAVSSRSNSVWAEFPASPILAPTEVVPSTRAVLVEA